MKPGSQGKASYSMQNHEMTDRSNDYNALRMRGLPYTVQEQDVVDFFSTYNISGNCIKLGRTPDGRSSGQAAILFQSEMSCKQAMNEK